MLKENKGITLVALVITIIVLLILAGVSIAMIGGENGILTNANEAKTENEKADANTAIAMAITEILTDYYAGDRVFTSTDEDDPKLISLSTVATLAGRYTDYDIELSGNNILVKNGDTVVHTYSDVTIDTSNKTITFTKWS